MWGHHDHGKVALQRKHLARITCEYRGLVFMIMMAGSRAAGKYEWHSSFEIRPCPQMKGRGGERVGNGLWFWNLKPIPRSHQFQHLLVLPKHLLDTKPSNIWGYGTLIQITTGIKAGTQDKNLEEGAETKTMKEHCLLVCTLWACSVTFLCNPRPHLFMDSTQ